MSARLAQARLAACGKWPFASQAVLSMVPVPRPGLGTLAVDQHWRIYFDEAFLERIGTDLAAGVILHEVDHLLKRHHKRAEGFVDDNPQSWKDWNWATDATINESLRAEGVTLPEGFVYPETIEQETGLSAEEYYRALSARRREAEQQQPQQQPEGGDDDDDMGEGSEDGEPDSESGERSDDGHSGGDSGGDDGDPGDDDQGADCGGSGSESGSGEPDSATGGGGGDSAADSAGDPAGPGGSSDGQAGDVQGASGECSADGAGGSCSDGQQRPWELGEPSDDAPGLEEGDQEVLIHEAATQAAARGVGGANRKRWAEEVLQPNLDPAALLRHLVHEAVQYTSGVGERSYRRPSRRDYGAILMPGNFAPVPEIVIIVDTSGSMDKQQLGLALGMIRRVVESYQIQNGIRIVTGDDSGKTMAFTADPSEVELAGGGGTDMGVIIGQVVEDDPPHIVLVITDGVTPWPDQDVGVPVVACLTKEMPAWAKRHYPIPDWMEPVELYK